MWFRFVDHVETAMLHVCAYCYSLEKLHVTGGLACSLYEPAICVVGLLWVAVECLIIRIIFFEIHHVP